MKKHKDGLFIVIEGPDGSGKSTQLELLQKRLTTEAVPFTTFKFPQYGQPSAYFVEQYLGGHYGPAGEVPAKQACLFYAMDRYEAAKAIRQSLQAGQLVLADRYVAANMAFNGAKISSQQTRLALYEWIDETEFSILGIPRPNLNVILMLSPEQAAKNIANRLKKDSSLSRDSIEQDDEMLKQSILVYKELIDLYPAHFYEVSCTKGSQSMRTTAAIHEDIWAAIEAHQ